MKEIIEDKIKEIKKRQWDYLDMLEYGNKYFTDEYITERVKECRIEIDVLTDVLKDIIESE